VTGYYKDIIKNDFDLEQINSLPPGKKKKEGKRPRVPMGSAEVIQVSTY
jgi:hypothetical protein